MLLAALVLLLLLLVLRQLLAAREPQLTQTQELDKRDCAATTASVVVAVAAIISVAAVSVAAELNPDALAGENLSGMLVLELEELLFDEESGLCSTVVAYLDDAL